MVKAMRRGSVILDFSVDQGGTVETVRLTPSEEFAYTQDGVVHFAVPNVPSWVPRTASHALSNQLVNYLLAFGRDGWREALKALPELQTGVDTCCGYVTGGHLPSDAGRGFRPIGQLLEEDA
jgi:alanine dehydrogenase